MARAARIAAGAAAVLLLAAAAAIAAFWAPDRPVEALQARWAPAPSAFLEIQGLRVHVRDEGPRDDPVPIVLLHGTSASLHTWDGWTEALRGERRVIRFDLPGFGLTGPTADDVYVIERYLRVLVALLARLEVWRCVLAGNSFGGQVAWEAALALPEVVERLILVDAAGYPMQPASVPIGFRLARIPVLNRVFEFMLPRAIVAASVRNVYGDPGRVDEALIDRYYELALRAGNRAALPQRLAQAPAGRGAERIAKLRLPVLILWGGRDRLIPLENARRFHADIAGSELVVFDDLGHVPQEEDPARTIGAVKRFLARH